jgi:hypothetical protein
VRPGESDSRPADNGPATKSLGSESQSNARADDSPSRCPESSPAFDEWIRDDAPPLTGIDRAIINASAWDVENFRKAVLSWADRPQAFTIEAVLEDTGVPLDHVNRIGALTAALAREGAIVRVGYTKARRASRASGVVAVWRGSRWSS